MNLPFDPDNLYKMKQDAKALLILICVGILIKSFNL